MSSGFSAGSEIELTVESMAFTGRGVGRCEGRVIFVAGGVPGDQVRARITKRKRSYAEAEIVAIEQPSPDRIVAPCRHFDICGGCSFQNVPYERQLEYKRQFVYDALLRIGGEPEPPVREIVPCANHFFYRNKMEFSFLPVESGPPRLGLHVRGEWSKIFDIEECLLQSDTSNRIVAATRELVHSLGIPAYHISEHHGFIRFLVIREDKKSGRILLNLVTAKGEHPGFEQLVASLTQRFPLICQVWRTVNSSLANVAAGESEELIWKSGDFWETIGQDRFLVTPSTFLQTNSEQTEMLYSQVARLGSFDSDNTVLDLYSGCGTISHFISRLVNSVLGVEINENAVSMARQNAILNGVTNCDFETADVAVHLKALKQSDRYFDRVVIDPPRAGAGNKVVRRLARLKPPVVVYVSCNPSTLARDIEQFRLYGYKLVQTVPVDMFPHTYHVESVNRLELA